MRGKVVVPKGFPPVAQPVAGGRGCAGDSDRAVLALADHWHVWVRLPGTVGLFVHGGEDGA